LLFAVEALIVEFQDEPLFNEANFLPGQSITRWIRVTNNSGETQRIATEAINVNNSDNLGNVLNLEIKEGSIIHYSNSLSDFFNTGEVFLSDLGNGNNTQYDFSVSFYPGAYDSFQGKSLSFDFLVGFQGADGGLLPGAGSGSGGSLPTGFTILEDSVRTNVQKTSVTISWTTTYFSTSQVIYGAEGESHTLDLSDTAGTPPKYGYAHTTPEEDIAPKVTAHSVTVYGLTPGTTYHFRCLSHASPPSISRGHSFVTLTETGEAGTGEEPEEESWEAGTSGGFTYGGSNEQEESNGENKEPVGITQGSDKEEGSWVSFFEDEKSPDGEKKNLLDKTSKGLASMFSAIKGFLGRISQSTFFVTLIILFLIALCLIVIRRRTSSKEEDNEI